MASLRGLGTQCGIKGRDDMKGYPLSFYQMPDVGDCDPHIASYPRKDFSLFQEMDLSGCWLMASTTAPNLRFSL